MVTKLFESLKFGYLCISVLAELSNVSYFVFNLAQTSSFICNIPYVSSEGSS